MVGEIHVGCVLQPSNDRPERLVGAASEPLHTRRSHKQSAEKMAEFLHVHTVEQYRHMSEKLNAGAKTGAAREPRQGIRDRFCRQLPESPEQRTH
jgi:hypothetical protein